jgi:hypothetical protein
VSTVSTLLPTRPLYRRLVLAATIFLGLAALVLVLTPYGIKLGIEHALVSLGAQRATIEDVDFNPFSGRLRLTALEVQGGGQPPLRLAEAGVQMDWWPLWHRHVLLQAVNLKGLQLHLAQGPDNTFQVAGMVLPPQTTTPPPGPETTAPETPWGVGIQHLTLNGIQIEYAGKQLTLNTRLDDLQLRALRTWDTANPATLNVAGSVNGAPLHLTLEATPLAEPRRLKGSLQIQNLDLAAFQQPLAEVITGLQGKLATALEFDATLGPDTETELHLNGNLKTTTLGLQMPQQQLAFANDSLTWQGNVKLHYGTQGTGLTVEGELKQHNLTLSQQAMQARYADLDWQGVTRLQMKEQHTDLNLQGQLNNQELRLSQPQLRAGYGHLKWLGTAAFTQDPQHTTWSLAGDLSNDKLVVAREDKAKAPPLLETKTIQITGLHVAAGPEVEAAAIVLDGVKVRLKRDPAGNMVMPGATAATPAGEQGQQPSKTQTTASPAATPAATKPVARIKQLRVTGDSGIWFDDQSVTPRFHLAMQLTKLDMENLDSSQPQHPATLALAGKLGPYSSFDIQGQVYPFAEPPSLDLQGNIQSLDLPPLSSYTNEALGYNLTSGHLNAKLKFKVNKGVIDSENRLTLKQLKLEPSDPDKMDKFSKKLTMPLDTALSLLRDKHDNIKLKLPITGDINNPEFSVADAINQALGKAMNFAAMYYLKLALQPYSTLISIYQAAGTAGKMINVIRLDPVGFNAGESQLDGKDLDYLATTVKLLQNRPKMILKICGKATRDDLEALRAQRAKQTPATAPQPKPGADTPPPAAAKPDAGPTPQEQEQLLSLARHRSEVIKAQLVKEGGIDPGRLFLCNPEVDPAKDAKPRAELLV